MLNKTTLKERIEDAIETAMIKAFDAALLAAKCATEKDPIFNNNIAEAFASEAKKCSDEIADAIDEFVRSAQLIIPAGTSFSQGSTLSSPAGPVSGSITFSSSLVADKVLH